MLQENLSDNTDPVVNWNSAIRRWALASYDEDTIIDTNAPAESIIGTPIVGHGVTEGWVANLKKLDWDSKFFGIRMGRLEPFIVPTLPRDYAPESSKAFVAQCLHAAAREQLNHLSVQVHCRDTFAHTALQESGFFIADTIVEYKCNLKNDLGSKHFNSDDCVVEATEDHRLDLMRISRQCFGNNELNANRFNNDLSFAQEKVARMYEIWISKSVNKEMADQVLVYLHQGKVVGFITISLPKSSNSNIASIPLNAVDPDYHRRGIYTKLVRAACEWLRERSISGVAIRTQLPNLGVHNTWTNIGGQMSRAFHTFHFSRLQEKLIASPQDCTL